MFMKNKNKKTDFAWNGKKRKPCVIIKCKLKKENYAEEFRKSVNNYTTLHRIKELFYIISCPKHYLNHDH